MGIYPDKIKKNEIIIGWEVMKAFTTIFDFQNYRIGFWTKNNDYNKLRYKKLKNP